MSLCVSVCPSVCLCNCVFRDCIRVSDVPEYSSPTTLRQGLSETGAWVFLTRPVARNLQASFCLCPTELALQACVGCQTCYLAAGSRAAVLMIVQQTILTTELLLQPLKQVLFFFERSSEQSV